MHEGQIISFLLGLTEEQVGIQTIGSGWLSRYDDPLRVGPLGGRILVEDRFPPPVQNGLGLHTSPCTRSTGLFPGVKWPERGVDYPPSPSAEVKEIAEVYLYFISGFSWSILG
jgi:hypothetical protein